MFLKTHEFILVCFGANQKYCILANYYILVLVSVSVIQFSSLCLAGCVQVVILCVELSAKMVFDLLVVAPPTLIQETARFCQRQ